ncbi:MAG: hypothetical protein EON89_00845 [Brevundimonas sp.]|nr:MAG: hypothetical protein EON89_00845 [Brevundimonas sp.]
MTVHVRFSESFPLRQCEWLLATVMSGCGIMAVGYPDQFARSQTLSALLRYADQPVWAWAMTVVGLVGWFALARNGGWKRSPAVRAGCAAARGVIWLQLFMALAKVDQPTWGLIFFPAFMTMEFINAYRAAGDAKAVSNRTA